MSLKSLSESNYSDSGQSFALTMKIKALFFINKHIDCPPSLLIQKLNIAKSNLALLSKSLIKEGLIVANKKQSDKRNIFYSTTQKGKQELTRYYDSLTKVFHNRFKDKEQRLFDKKIDELLSILKPKK